MMAYKSKSEKTGKKLAEETHDIWKTYSKKRENWANNAQEDREFRLGKQWTSDQKRILEERGQAALVVNRIHPAVEAAKALITANKPQFRVSPREDSDNSVAQAMNGLLEYIWQISEGNSVIRRVVDDYYVTGLGAALVYIDPMMDMGKGEVCIHDVDPLDIYIDPNSRSAFADDAENVIISRLYTKDQAQALYPMYKKAIKNANTETHLTDRPNTAREDDGETVWPESTETQTIANFGESKEYIRGYERYYPVMIDHYRIFEGFSGNEDLLDEEDYQDYLKQPAWIIQGQVIDNEEQAQMAMQQLQQMYQQKVEQGRAQGRMDLPSKPEIEEVTFEQLVDEGHIDIVIVPTKRIKQCVVMGDKHLYSRVLPIDKYPIVFFMNQHTRTPYPMSDVRMVKGMQEYINKTRSLIIAHATTSTNTKILIPSGSVDMREFEQKWAQPGVAIEVDFDQGQPTPVQPTPLPNELYNNETTAKNDIDHQLGLYEMTMGNSAVAPHTYKATVSLDEFGQRKMKSKLADIEAGLNRLGQIAIPIMQQLYTTQKVVRLIQPNNSINEYTINKRLFDDKSGEIEVINDITVGKYDVVVVTGSTMPTNRMAQLEMYMDAYEKGIIDKQEVLKKTEVFDMQGVMQRTDLIEQLKGQLEQATETIKSMQGDLQTREREIYHAKMKAEIEKTKSNLKGTENRAKMSGTLFEKRLDDALGQVKKEVAEASSKPGSPSSGPKKKQSKK
tara:strand:- start:1595 stop:3787 length:2193 start_codon:yes stop_codon:yes gene_type:complete